MAEPISGVAGKVQHVRWADVPLQTLSPKLDRQFVVGTQTMVARIFLKKGCTVPTHSHPNEQGRLSESGALVFTVEGQEYVVRAGELFCTPPNVPHMAIALEDTVNIDFFVPPRQDWLDGTDSYLR